MDPDVQRMTQVLVLVSAFATFVVTISLAAWFVVRKFRGTPLPTRDSDPRIDDSRFARLEDAVDSIAIEVERIAEAQRFTAKLMSERLPDRLSDSTLDRAKQL
jgi:hypothetical protein